MKNYFTRVASSFLFALMGLWSVNAAAQDCSTCTDNCVVVNVTEGGFAAEVGWSLLDDTGAVVATGGAPTVDLVLCLVDGCYSFDMTDTFGDGWNGAAYTLTNSIGAVIQTGDLDNADAGDGSSAGADVLTLGGATGCVVAGCTDPGACNFDDTANTDDGSCEFLTCAGCTDATACNFDAANTIEDGSCDFSCYGCTDPAASNFDPAFTIDDGSCITCTESYAEFRMTDTFGDGWNGNVYIVQDENGVTLATGDIDSATTGDGAAEGSDFFCLPASACLTIAVDGGAFQGEVAWALLVDGVEVIAGGAPANTFLYTGASDPGCAFEGCTNPIAVNFNQFAAIDDGSCLLPPPNDQCGNAEIVACGDQVLGTTTNASSIGQDGLESCSSIDITSGGVWYQIDGTGDQITVETCGSAGGDTKLHVFETPTDCNGLTCVGANDDACGLLSAFTWVSNPGTSYYVLVSQFGAAPAPIDFTLDVSCVDCSTPVVNDDCATATVVSDGVVINGSLCCAEAAASNPCVSAFATTYDVWFTLNSGNFDDFFIFLENVDNETIGFTVFEDAGTGCVDLTPLACCGPVTAQCGGDLSDFTTIQPNTDYYFQIWTANPAACGGFTFSVAGELEGCLDPIACNFDAAANTDDGSCEYVGNGPDGLPGTADDCIVVNPNDACGDAAVVACGDVYTGSTGGATAGDAPSTIVGCDPAPGAGVWATFVGTGDLVTLDFCGSDIDARVNVYESDADCAGVFTCVEADAGDLDNCGFFLQDDPFVQFVSTAGTNYYIYVGTDDTDGTFTMDVSCEPVVLGCTDAGACNFNELANVDDDSCDFFSCVCPDATGTPVAFNMEDTFGDGWNGNVYTITDGTGTVIATGDLDNAAQGDGASVGTDFICLPTLLGCFTVVVEGGAFAGEVVWSVALEDGTVLASGGSPDPVQLSVGGAVCGCTDATACNFDDLADSDDGSCEFDSCAGCTDPTACNFDAGNTIDVPEDCCFDVCVTLNLTDTFGDTWNGATYTIADAVTGDVVSTGDLQTAQTGDGESNGSNELCLVDGCYTIIAGGGTFDGEIGWSLIGVNGGIVSGGATPDGPVFFSVGTGDCVEGCAVAIACNFDETVIIPNLELCDFESCLGCTYEEATNFDSEAIIDDGSCEGFGNSSCPADLDGNGVVGVGDLIEILGVFGSQCP